MIDINPEAKQCSAAIIIIGDEILSGKTQEANIRHIALNLSEIGILLNEVRIIADHKHAIIEAVNALRCKHDFVFSTGGIGPTHDDVTSEAMAEAFQRNLECNEAALAIITQGYEAVGKTLSEGSKRMAVMPQNVDLINNTATTAPGYRIENVFVMAGIPWVMHAMFEEVIKYILVSRPELGTPFYTESVEINIGEGLIAHKLGELQKQYPSVSIGSYPFKTHAGWGANIHFRSKNEDAIKSAVAGFKLALKELKE
jgi:molybdenum cofactor synthesis domain-containing protein